MIRKVCILVLDGQGVRVGKGTRGREPPQKILPKANLAIREVYLDKYLDTFFC